MYARYSSIAIYNCTADRVRLHTWRRDATAGGPFTEVGSIIPQYDSAGTCPAYGSSPFIVNFPVDDRIYEVVAVAPDGYVCGGNNDPTLLACRRDGVTVRADPSARQGVASVI